MSDIFFSLDRVIRSEVEVKPSSRTRSSSTSTRTARIEPDCLTSHGGNIVQCVVRCVRTRPRFFKPIFSSLISGNEVSLTLIINDGTLES
jgi:hypothetical protein